MKGCHEICPESMERFSTSPLRLRRATNHRGAKLFMRYRQEHFEIVQGLLWKCRNQRQGNGTWKRSEEQQASENTEVRGYKGIKDHM